MKFRQILYLIGIRSIGGSCLFELNLNESIIAYIKCHQLNEHSLWAFSKSSVMPGVF